MLMDALKRLFSRKSVVKGESIAEKMAKNNVRALLTEAQFAMDHNDLRRAIECHEKAMGIDANNAEVMIRLADLYKRHGDNAKADQALTKVSQIYHSVGVSMMEKKDIDKAIAAFEKERKISPRDGKVYVNLAVAYYHQKNYGRAAQCSKCAVNLGQPLPADLEKALAAVGR